MKTTTDLSDFGYRELKMAADLLQAYCNGNKPEWLGDDIQLMMNTGSGYVFLTDQDCNVAMLNGDELDAFLFTPHDGHEGFIDELTEQYAPDDLNCDDEEYLRNWAETLDFDLPENWQQDEGEDE